ncbi:N-acetylmuramic acid 6-phosphate etherase [Allosphingosinicella deserti]|uniref:N-acetylmuramic acid 6-phosphate etherase n=1 Tax=Allosphingosinicella deserti TaxID=2116704 RepID=A0A2P7QJ72_9SPHN|nr:N-acetylmuramic acid 6-phosphate etherase [Sphingomonas deserti]PSJ38009.1 N-acetylmuramic acid 6-phosphate etherase [Sphingomonas deserti]
MSTELMSPRYAALDLWPTGDAVQAMLEGQLAAAASVQSQAGAIAAAAEAAAERLQGGRGRLIYAGAGTSGRLAVLDGVELAPTFNWGSERVVPLMAGGMTALLTSVEGAEDDGDAGEQELFATKPTPCDVVIGVAASGRTPYTVAAVRAGATAGALTIGIACNPGTPLLAVCAHPILLDTGAEVVAGSTRMKAGTAQKIALNLLSTAIMLRLGRVHDGLMVDMRLSNRKLRDRAAIMVGTISGVSRSQAEAALEQSGGRIKPAALVALGAAPDQASALLQDAGDNLRLAIARLRGDAAPAA